MTRVLALVAFLIAAEGARPQHALHIYKADRKMTLEIGGKVAKTFVIALGRAPIGDKEKQGDYKTPEGEHYLAWKNERSQFHRFLGLSYPMPGHAEHGLKAHLITRREVDAIERAAKAKVSPPQTTALGGFVGIHGGGTGWDWTYGCIAVTDEEIEWLFSEMKVGDRIVVHP
jgi:murein L,D-transpeptidase YafK